jgi:hypothetical protein
MEVRLSSDLVFHVGDWVIVGSNNHQTFCFNGEIGEIVDLSPRSLTLRIEDVESERLLENARDDWSQLQLAYAITSHRVQGSEWDNVVVVLSQSHFLMLQRNLLYTALTRSAAGRHHCQRRPEEQADRTYLHERARSDGGERSHRTSLQRTGRAPVASTRRSVASVPDGVASNFSEVDLRPKPHRIQQRLQSRIICTGVMRAIHSNLSYV